jgi:thymidylate synthase (FAD)
MDCWRQWIRHRTASVNEYSTRYSEAIDAAQKTLPGSWRQQAVGNRQGSGGFLSSEIGELLSREESDLQIRSREIYEHRLSAGVAREQARKDLPLSTYTEAYWKIDLHNLFHFLILRMDSHAQVEIRAYANVIGGEIVSRWCPLAWEAFTDYRLQPLSLHRLDLEIAKFLVAGRGDEAIQLAVQAGFLSVDGRPSKTNRERSELESKLRRLGLPIPWLGPEQ